MQFSYLFNEDMYVSMSISKLIRMNKVKTMETPLVKIHYVSRSTWNGKCSLCQRVLTLKQVTKIVFLAL